MGRSKKDIRLVCVRCLAPKPELAAKGAQYFVGKFVKNLFIEEAFYGEVLMHAIDKIVPVAKQEIEHSGAIVYEIMTNVDFDKLLGRYENRLSLEPNIIFAKSLSRWNATHLPIGTLDRRSNGLG